MFYVQSIIRYKRILWILIDDEYAESITRTSNSQDDKNVQIAPNWSTNGTAENL